MMPYRVVLIAFKEAAESRGMTKGRDSPSSPPPPSEP